MSLQIGRIYHQLIGLAALRCQRRENLVEHTEPAPTDEAVVDRLGRSTDPFATQGAVYRRPIDSNGPLQPLGGGMPKWIDGIADTNCIATRDSMAAVIDRSGCLYVSHDHGATWSCPFDRLTVPSGLHIC